MPTPEEIAQRRFLLTLRGYDRDQVHAFLGEVSQHVADLERRNAELTAELEAARAEQASASQPPATATSSADDRPFAALGEETQRVLEAAQEAAASINRKARQDADRQIQAARQRAAQVIAEGERRRKKIDKTIAELEQRREQLARELAGVGGTIERVLSDLVPDEEAPTVREALSEAAAEALEAARARESGGSRRAQERGAEVVAADRAAAADAPADEDASGDEEPRPSEEAVGSEAQTTAAPADALAEDAVAESVSEAWPADEAAKATKEPEAPLADEEAEAPEGSAEDSEAAAELAAAEGAEAAEELAAGEDSEAAEDGEVADEPAPAVEAGATDEPPADEASEEVAPASAEDEASPEPADAASPVTLRAGALEPIHPKLMRRVKRGMSDLQNLVLDRLRRHGGKRGSDALVPSEEEMAVLAEVGEAFLDQAYEAGVQAAAVLAGRHLGVPQRARSLEAEFATDGGQRIAESLEVSLRIGVDGGEEPAALNDRVGAVFSELKSTVADELSAVHLIRAYEYGLLDAWAAGGLGRRTWMLGRELRCPEGRCRRNDEIGAVDVSEPFPSGHEVPPVHVGCTCTTVPVPEA